MGAETLSSLITAIFAAITGTAGLILSIINYFHDRPNIQIILKWDMKPYGSAVNDLDPNKLWGYVSVTNIGRRPVYVSHVHLDIPNFENTWLLAETVSGEKLLEGDPPKTYPISQEGLEEFKDRWSKIRAVVLDSTGKKYYSKPAENIPSWARVV